MRIPITGNIPVIGIAGLPGRDIGLRYWRGIDLRLNTGLDPGADAGGGLCEAFRRSLRAPLYSARVRPLVWTSFDGQDSPVPSTEVSGIPPDIFSAPTLLPRTTAESLSDAWLET